MSEDLTDRDVPSEFNKIGPDYFGYYASQVAGLLSRDEAFLPFSPRASDAGINHVVLEGTTVSKDEHSIKEDISKCASVLFSDSVGTRLPELKKERLKSLLKQSVVALSQEVDEMIDPILSICQIQECLKYKRSLSKSTTSVFETNEDQPPHKKIRVSNSSPDAETKKGDITLPGKGVSDGIVKKCAQCPATEIYDELCSVCRIRKQNESPFVKSDAFAEKENGEANGDLQFLLESDSAEVEEVMKKHSGELLKTIEHMERMLDKLLNIAMSTCRPMVLLEKQELQRLIQNLPARNIDHAVEIIGRSRPVQKAHCNEIDVDLEKEEDITLWRLYYYVQAVESARKLRQAQP